MAGRKPDPNTPYRVYPHKDKQYIYAALLESYIRSDGKKANKPKHIGKVTDDLLFIPNDKYCQLSQAEKDKLIFPPEWDIHMIEEQKDTYEMKAGIPLGDTLPRKTEVVSDRVAPSPPFSHKKEIIKEENRLLYGSFWILESLSRKCGLYDDLLEALDGDIALVREVLTLSFYPYLSGRDYSRLAKWQRIHKTLLDAPLDQNRIEKKISFISQTDFLNVLDQRRMRLFSEETTTSPEENICIVFILKKDVQPRESPQDFAAVGYSLRYREVVYYQSLPWYQKDTDALTDIQIELQYKFHDSKIIFLLDEDFSSLETLLTLNAMHCSFILPVSLSSPPISLSLPEINLDHFGDPQNMRPIAREKLYEKKIALFLMKDGEVKSHREDSPKEKNNLILHLYLDKAKKEEEVYLLKNQVDAEKELVLRASPFVKPPADLPSYQKKFLFHEVKEKYGVGGNFQDLSYEYCPDRFMKRFSSCGLFAFLESPSASEEVDVIEMTKLQEMLQFLLFQGKAALLSPEQNRRRKKEEVGEDLLDYIALLLFSKLLPACKREYDSPLELLDEMEPILFFETGDRAGWMSYFTPEQLQICDRLGITPPEDSIPTSLLKEREKTKQ